MFNERLKLRVIIGKIKKISTKVIIDKFNRKQV
jgi:hypothetical protein